MNKQLHMREKFQSAPSQQLIQKLVKTFVNLGKKYNVLEYIRQANLQIIELSKDPQMTPDEFQ